MKDISPVTLKPPRTRNIVCLVLSDIVSALPVNGCHGYRVRMCQLRLVAIVTTKFYFNLHTVLCVTITGGSSTAPLLKMRFKIFK